MTWVSPGARTAHDEQEIAALRKGQRAGEPEGPIVVRYSARVVEFAVPEWQATLDALQELPESGAVRAVGYVGIREPRPCHARISSMQRSTAFRSLDCSASWPTDRSGRPTVPRTLTFPDTVTNRPVGVNGARDQYS
ncbi:hypothetical protein [Streptomyces sp. NPDC046759]|uniref:hypothetical protein n=1 Tax=Streptomyces sp. NPDC046759 TaxID=3155019 RepID=UPI0033DE62F4